ncbi:hypothetical protein M3484_08950 [Pseudomonas sp. GX19020]|uniref:hypothetical protein n=1 Tax=Pseudomonas sp. GX19020 TaxID=2942277 RepID=UPI002018A6CD|nr:hypothetical protein [Pseudomonas sp. GX19020]MCL4066699.1 hypothetical protein [Pseudomonas sp. GX19020]
MADIITLKTICDELKLNPRKARQRLRTAAADNDAYKDLAEGRKPKAIWQWADGSKALEIARKVLAG